MARSILVFLSLTYFVHLYAMPFDSFYVDSVYLFTTDMYAMGVRDESPEDFLSTYNTHYHKSTLLKKRGEMNEFIVNLQKTRVVDSIDICSMFYYRPFKTPWGDYFVANQFPMDVRALAMIPFKNQYLPMWFSLNKIYYNGYFYNMTEDIINFIRRYEKQ